MEQPPIFMVIACLKECFSLPLLMLVRAYASSFHINYFSCLSFKVLARIIKHDWKDICMFVCICWFFVLVSPSLHLPSSGSASSPSSTLLVLPLSPPISFFMRKYRVMINSIATGASLPGFESYFFQVLSVWHFASTSLFF